MPTITLYPVTVSSSEWSFIDSIKNDDMDQSAYRSCPSDGIYSGTLKVTDFGIPDALPENAVVRSIKFQIAYSLFYEGTPNNNPDFSLWVKLKGWNDTVDYMSDVSIRDFGYVYETAPISASEFPEVSDSDTFDPGETEVGVTLSVSGMPRFYANVYYLRVVVDYLLSGPLDLAGEISSSSGLSGAESKRLWVQNLNFREVLSGGSSVFGSEIRYALKEVDGGSPLLGSLDFDGEIDGGSPSTTTQEFEGEIDGGNPRTILYDFAVRLLGRIAGESSFFGEAVNGGVPSSVEVPLSGVVVASSGVVGDAETATEVILSVAVDAGAVSGATARVTMEVFSGGSTGALSSFSGVSAVILLSSGAAEGGSFLGAWIEKGILSKGTASAGTTSSALTERSMAASGTISPSSGGEGRHELTILRRGETGSLSGGDSTATVILRGAGIISSISGRDAVPILVSRGVGRSEAESFLSGAALVTILGSGEAMMESGGKSLAEVGKHLSGSLGGESEVAARAYSVTETSIRITSSAGVKGRALVERLTKGDSFGTSGAEGNGIIKTPPVLVGRITPDGVLSIKGVLIEGAESIRFTSSGDLHAGSLVEGEEGISIEGTEIRVKALHESAL